MRIDKPRHDGSSGKCADLNVGKGALEIRMLGDRRDYFESLSDVWELFRVIIEQRKQRELNPTLSMLRNCAVEVADDKETDEVTKQRIRNMLQFVETTNDWYEQIQGIPTSTLQKIMKLGTKITGLLDR